MVFLTACAGGDSGLRDLRSAGGGPDEFAVIPNDPLVMPQDRSLPQPTPSGRNLADIDPGADAIRALGGQPAARTAGGLPQSDAALLAHAGGFAAPGDIRAQLAREDAALRDRAQLLNRFNPLGRDRYFPTYARQALDARAELARLQAQGVAVPTIPAPIVEDQGRPRGLLGQLGLRGNCVLTTVGAPDGRLRRLCGDDRPDVSG